MVDVVKDEDDDADDGGVEDEDEGDGCGGLNGLSRCDGDGTGTPKKTSPVDWVLIESRKGTLICC